MGRLIAGHGLLVLGVLGLVLPILQGGLFLALGMFVLRDHYAWSRRGLAWAEARWPNAVARVEGMEAGLIQRWQRFTARIARLFGRRDEPRA